MRLWITAFLFALLCLQAIPVAGIWRSIASSEIVADIDDRDDEDGAPGSEESKIKKQSVSLPDEYLHERGFSLSSVSQEALPRLTLHGPAILPLRYAGEVPTPPPDFS